MSTRAAARARGPQHAAPRRPVLPSAETLGHALVVLVAAALWLIALPDVDVARTSGWGLLPALPPAWWAALALAVLPQAFATLRARIAAPVFWAYQAVLALVLFATTSAAYVLPRYPWTFKHVGVVELLLQTGTIDRTVDIYHNWPGFFVLAAVVSGVTGIEPLAVAQWTQPVLGLAGAAAVAFAVGALTRDRRVVWTAVLVFTVANWVGQNYYAPQGLATILGLLFLGVVLRALPVRDGDGELALRPWLRRRLRGRTVPPLPAPARSGRGALAGATALWVALVVSHQLTPVALVLQLALLAAMTRLRAAWIIAVWVAIEVAWVALALPFVLPRFDLLQFDALTSLTPSVLADPVLPGAALATRAAPVVVALVGLLALGATAARLRRGRADLLPWALAAAPALALVAQSYGGEGLFRAYLYALPWLALLIAGTAVHLAGRGLARRVAIAAVLAALTAASTVAMFGQELLHQVTPADLAASAWFESETPAGAFVEPVVGADMSLKATAGYAAHPTRDEDLVELVTALDDGTVDVAGFLDGAAGHLRALGPNGHLAITEFQYTWARYYGLLTEQELDAIATALERRPDFLVEYRDGRIVVARYVGPS